MPPPKQASVLIRSVRRTSSSYAASIAAMRLTAPAERADFVVALRVMPVAETRRRQSGPLVDEAARPAGQSARRRNETAGAPAAGRPPRTPAEERPPAARPARIPPPGTKCVADGPAAVDGRHVDHRMEIATAFELNPLAFGKAALRRGKVRQEAASPPDRAGDWRQSSGRSSVTTSSAPERAFIC